MLGHINIPSSIPCRVCKYCGSRPVIALSGKDAYVVKCPADDSHYQTQAEIIDIDEWNHENFPLPETELNDTNLVACYDSKLNYTFFLPV
jgi:hypothetical protein